MKRYIRSVERPHQLHEARAAGERSYNLAGAPSLPKAVIEKLAADWPLTAAEEAESDRMIAAFCEHHKQLRTLPPYTGPAVRNDDEE